MIIFGLLKNSGKLKGIIQEACKSENIQHFTVSKITGTTQFLLIFELLIFTKLKFIIKGYNKKASEKKTLLCVITFSLKCLSKQVMLFKKQCTIPWVVKKYSISPVCCRFTLNQQWCAPTGSTDVSRESVWWSGSRQPSACCQFGCQISLECQDIWVVSYSESASFMLKF